MGIREIANSFVRFAGKTVDNAEQTAVKTVKPLASKPEQFDSAVSSIAARFAGANPVEDITRGLVGKAENLPVREIGGRAENAAQGFGEWIGEKAGDFLEGAGNVVGNTVNRFVDAGRSVVNGLTEGIYGYVRSVFEGAGQTLTGVGEMLNPAPLAKVFQGDFSGAWNDFTNNLKQGAFDVGRGIVKMNIQALADSALVGLSHSVSAVQTLLGLEPPSRALNEQEIAELRKVYGNTIDYSQIRLKEGFIGANQLLAPHTVGNTIYIPQGRLDPNSSNYIQERNQLLVHETGHVWQYQTGGTDYIGESLYHQAKGWLSGASRNAAYDFEQPIKDGKTWAELNPEQQAHLIEEAYVQGLFDDPNARFVYRHHDYTDYVRNAIHEMRERRGAA